MNNHDIWYRELDDWGRIEITRKDKERVEEITGKIVRSILPPGRSISYGPELERFVVTELRKQNVSYEIRHFQHDRFFVWRPEDEIAFTRAEETAKKKFWQSLQSDLPYWQ